MARNIDKTESITKASYFLGVVWSLSLVIGTILVSILELFSFWWILIIITLLSIGLFIIHLKITRNIMNNINVDKNIFILHWLCFIQLLALNIPLFAYEVIGILFYKKIAYIL
ncbi:hypothetical protein [Spiroplasma taiwanense]|uniref:Transmembrane protein n=1 Tax=Spiroplasma taiwanense CT-1 TaxID=1276220 RepID=S5MHL5_9MOLU|nr:hypothetical protein [Spiroplasma taiwanense]AGR41350.1 hypothetical protein STAIW_v1c07390 [Spiroplasma taiwanense CT-1]